MSRDGNRNKRAVRRKRNIYARILRESSEYKQRRVEGRRPDSRKGNKGNLKRELMDYE